MMAAGLRALLGELHQADLADLIEQMPKAQRSPLVLLLGEEFSVQCSDRSRRHGSRAACDRAALGGGGRRGSRA
jgi:Mg/Co/Ni transporter MgtE